MGGVRDRQQPGPNPLLAEKFRGQPLDGVGPAGNDRLPRAVHGRKGEIRAWGCQAASATRAGPAITANIRPSPGSDCDQTCPSGDQLQAFFERKDARRASRRIVAHAMPKDGRGNDSPRLPQFGKGIFEGEEAESGGDERFTIGRRISPSPRLACFLSSPAISNSLIISFAPLGGLSEHRRRFPQFAAHAAVDTVLAGKEEYDRRIDRIDHSRAHAGARPWRSHWSNEPRAFRPSRRQLRPDAAKMLAADLCGESDIGQKPQSSIAPSGAIADRGFVSGAIADRGFVSGAIADRGFVSGAIRRSRLCCIAQVFDVAVGQLAEGLRRLGRQG